MNARLLLIDNYDSFTWNLVQAFEVLGAAVQVVSGPELKSRWVGESEENLRQLFIRARQSAPALPAGC